MMRFNTYVLVVVVVVAFKFTLVCQSSAETNILDQLKETGNQLQKEVQNKIEQTEICATDEGCNRNFFSINNYCCSQLLVAGTCCNWYKYVTRNE